MVEAQYNWADPNLQEAAIRAASQYCKGKCTTAGYINWFAHYAEANRNYAIKFLAPHDPRNGWVSGFDADAEKALNNLARSFTNHDSAWDAPKCIFDEPCGWANNSPSMYPDEVRSTLQNNQKALFTYNPSVCGRTVLGDPNPCKPWFIPSGCVATYWLDKNQRDLNIKCPSVR